MCLPLLPAQGGWRALCAIPIPSAPAQKIPPWPRKYSLFPALPPPQGAGLGGKGTKVSFLSPCQHSSILLWPCEAQTGSLCLALEVGWAAGSTAQLGCFICCMCHVFWEPEGIFGRAKPVPFWHPRHCHSILGPVPHVRTKVSVVISAQKPFSLQCHCVSWVGNSILTSRHSHGSSVLLQNSSREGALLWTSQAWQTVPMVFVFLGAERSRHAGGGIWGCPPMPPVSWVTRPRHFQLWECTQPAQSRGRRSMHSSSFSWLVPHWNKALTSLW